MRVVPVGRSSTSPTSSVKHQVQSSPGSMERMSGCSAAAALIDRFGWLGQKPIHFGWERIVALGLLAVALVLLLRGD